MVVRSHLALRSLIIVTTALTIAGCGDELEAGSTFISDIGAEGGDDDVLVDGDDDSTPGAGADVRGDAVDGDEPDALLESETTLEDDIAEKADAHSDGDAGSIQEGDATNEDTLPPEPICPVGLVGCIEGDRLVCNDDGSAFERIECETGHCLDGQCVACSVDADCDTGFGCDAGACLAPPLAITTAVLPTGQVGAPYSIAITATGGVPPYLFAASDPPSGLTFSADGVLSGIPDAASDVEWEVQVKDDDGATDARVFVIEVVDAKLVITTASPLPKAIEGEPYSAQLGASGGVTPYYWGIKSGALPPGIAFGAGGLISGIPTEGGTFSFTVKALDDGAPTATAEKLFELPVGLAPLEIIGEQEVNLFVTKLITMPVIIVTPAFPVPYNQKLTAKGGKKPYTWAEEPLPGLVAGLIPGGGGLPEGLSLAADGTVSGGVTDPSLVANVTIPFTQITLSGFFFQARVSDSQDPAESKTALFILPTVPIGN
ncbi:MAG: hypothetical protein IV100_01315 [Myxococcales bacterium]|nr:hypothetical protein [Myxococcales bacterium]